jgi:murein DD-endopeptidase MepM/ murein hydrolase activator NlpD
MTGAFLMAVLAIVLAIVIAAPQYADPDPVAGAGASELSQTDEGAAETTLPADEAEVMTASFEAPTSKLPRKLRGYRWPVRGGMVARYYEAYPKGDFQIAGERMHDGLIITWFEGAKVKAAHKGTVVAAGRDWLEHVGFKGSVDKVYRRYAPIDDSRKAQKSDKGTQKSDKPAFPQGIVIDDGNGYYSVYTEIKDLLVTVGDKVDAGQPIAGMAVAEGKEMMRYRLVRMDGPWMMVHQSARDRGYPLYARERVDPLAVFATEANHMPLMSRKPPAHPPRLSEY